MKKLKAPGYHVLLKMREVEEKTSGGIVLPGKVGDRERLATNDAEVVDIGPLAWKDLSDPTPWCKVGDLVRIARYSGEVIVDEDTKTMYRLVNDREILAVWENSDE